MKILKLRLKNIHSLKGEHLIDFTSPPLLDAGLFAITGPTGAGKSTILDVITLSLFNKIPRFAAKGTESVSRNDIEKIGSVMTHFTDDAYAEIEYECHDRAYRSRWSISRARTGNLRDYDMELATLADNKIFDLKKSEVPDENERILGLRYEQFIRSILLSQGDFARFLKSDDKERAKLLEDITDSHIYREIGKRAFESAKIKEEELKSLRLQSNMITLAAEQDVAKLESNLQEYKKVLKSLNDDITKLSSGLQKINAKNQLLSKKNELQTLQISLEKKKSDFSHKATRLNKHQELDTFRHSLTSWQIENDRLEKLSASIGQQKIQAQKAGKILTTALNKMTEFVHSTVTESNFMAQMKSFENKIIDFDGQLKTLEQTGKSLKERLHSLFQKNNESYTIAIKESTNVEQQLQVASLRMLELNAMKRVFDGSKEELAETYHKVQEQILSLTSIYKDIKLAEENSALNDALLEQISGFESEIKVFESEQTTISVALQKLKTDIQNLNHEKEQWLKIASLDEHRAELKEDEPCPLCGSVHHPYAENIPVNIGQNEIYLHQLNTQLKEKENKEGQLKTNIAIKMSAIRSHRQRISENNDKILLILKAHPDIKISADKIAADIEHKKQLESAYKNELISRAEKEFLEETTAILNELQKVASQFREVRAQRMNLYSGSDINGDADKIQNLFSAAKESVQSLMVAVETNEKEHKASTGRWTQLNESLTSQLSIKGYSDPKTAILSILDDETLRLLLLEKENIQADETALNTTALQIDNDLKLYIDVPNDQGVFSQMTIELNNLNTKKDQIHQETGAIENELKNQNELKQKYQDFKNIISKKEKEATPILHLNTLIGDATGNKYAKFAQNISLKHLISLANARLVKLSDRYQLADSDIEEDMKILDLYQGNTTRSVKTLSGGETFIVSLALALSLADMASKNVRLDSLFIDEGFGTLDQETMEMALITLEKLQSEGNRTIGIISHVESLKERITTQIKVKKDNFGYSKILVE